MVSVESRGFLDFLVFDFDLDLDVFFFLLFDSVVTDETTEDSVVDSEASIVDSEASMVDDSDTMEAFIAASKVAMAFLVLVLVFFGFSDLDDLDSDFFFLDLTDDDSSFFSLFFPVAFFGLTFFLMRSGGDICSCESNRASNPKSNRESLSQPHFNESPSDDTSDGSSSISTAVASLLLVLVVVNAVVDVAVAGSAFFSLLLLLSFSSRFLQCFITPSKQEWSSSSDRYETFDLVSLLLVAAAFSFCSLSLVFHWFNKLWNRDSRVSTLLPVVVVAVCSEDIEAVVVISPSHGSGSGSSSSWKLHLLRECSVKLLVCSVRWSSVGNLTSSSTVLISFLGCCSFFHDLFFGFRFLSD